MPVDADAISSAIDGALALGVTEAHLYELAKRAVADALKNGSPSTSITTPAGVAFTIGTEALMARLPELRAAAIAARGAIAFGRAVLA